MWAVKWFLAVILILMVFGFALQNNNVDHKVSVNFVTWEYTAVPLWLVIYASFGFGVLFWLIVSVFQVLQFKSEIRRLNKSQNELQIELDNLRNLPIGEDDTGFNIKEET
ncbi:LapA family protein [candidate division KSB1 bacterium]|nr:LapA family protein [candidate division KSB1 bacterium]MCH8954080.1 LapA family protein [candidate division KSB1 bacterium]